MAELMTHRPPAVGIPQSALSTFRSARHAIHHVPWLVCEWGVSHTQAGSPLQACTDCSKLPDCRSDEVRYQQHQVTGTPASVAVACASPSLLDACGTPASNEHLRLGPRCSMPSRPLNP